MTPGNYFLFAADRSAGCGGAHLYDLGTFTFTAGKPTYVGLYPFWLPVVRPAATAWDAQVFVRNHASGARSVGNVSFLSGTTVVGQRNDVAANASGTVLVADEPINSYGGLVVPSQDSSVWVAAARYGQPAGYSGIVAPQTKNSVQVSAGWERAGTTLYVPLVKCSYLNRWSEIYVTNLGTQTTTISTTYYKEDGTQVLGGSTTLAPNARGVIEPCDHVDPGFYYSAKLTNNGNQPLAAVVLEGENAGLSKWLAAYNAFNGGNTTLYAPLVKKNYAGHTTGITIQNITSSAATFEARYYDMNGSQQGQLVTGTISPYAPYVLYNPVEIPEGFWGSVRITSTNGKALVGQMSESNGSDGRRLMSNLALGGSTTVYLPLWYDYYTAEGGNWKSGVNIRNAGSAGENNLVVTWYRQDGTVALTRTWEDDPPMQMQITDTEDTLNVYDTPLTGFRGSVMIWSESNKPIVAVSNIRNLSGAAGTDTVMAFNGSNR